MDSASVPLPDKPEDFADFWRDQYQTARAVPLDFRRERAPLHDTHTHQVDAIVFRGASGEVLHGWIAYPAGAHRELSFVWLPPYGRESKLPDAYGTRPGLVSGSLNYFGESAFHQEAYVRERGYFGQGAEGPETWIFGRMFQNGVIFSRILQAQSEVDEARIGVAGMSQGGGMGIWHGAWNPIIKSVVADMPFLGEIGRQLHTRVHRYPLKELQDAMEEIPIGEARVPHTVSYFDTVYHASHCMVPTQVTVGLKDPACRPDTVRAIFDALPGVKRYKVLDWGHDWHPDMIPNTEEWFRENIR